MPKAEIDWALLREQKESLWDMVVGQPKRSVQERETLEGVIGLIDHLQDSAVQEGRATEAEVFGQLWLVYSPSEAAQSEDVAGYWSNTDGWTTLEQAERFNDHEKSRMTLPMSAGGDATWFPIAYSLKGVMTGDRHHSVPT